MGQLHPVNSMLENPMVNSLDVHFNLSRNLLKCAQDLSAGEGYIFKNLEKDGEYYYNAVVVLKDICSADYPYINYYVINKPRDEAGQFYTNNKVASHQALNASKLGYSLSHSMDLYDEVKKPFLCLSQQYFIIYVPEMIPYGIFQQHFIVYDPKIVQ